MSKQVPNDFLNGGSGLNKGHPYRTKSGSLWLAMVLASMHSRYALAAEVAALPEEDRDGVIAVGDRLFMWRPDSLANDSTNQVSIRPTAIDAGSPGRFEIATPSFALSFATSYQTLNDAVLFTVPAGFRLIVERVFHRVGTTYVNAAGRIGASSSNAAYATAGDLIGGAGGDADTALTAGVRGGTLGTAFGSNGVVELVAGDTIKWNVIAPGFTAGAGELVVVATRS